MTRANQEADFPGSFYPIFSGGVIFLHGSRLQNSGAFRFEVVYEGPFYDVIPLPGPGVVWPLDFTVGLDFGKADFYTMDSVPWLVERPAPDDWNRSDGLEFVAPITGTITEAYIVVQGQGLPEPATLSLLALGALAILRRGRR